MAGVGARFGPVNILRSVHKKHGHTMQGASVRAEDTDILNTHRDVFASVIECSYRLPADFQR